MDKPTICTMCIHGITIGQTGYRCVKCRTGVCNHMGYGNSPFCPNCVPDSLSPLRMRHDDGHMVTVVKWFAGQFAEVKTSSGIQTVEKHLLNYVQ
jgi:hypothetical protein